MRVRMLLAGVFVLLSPSFARAQKLPGAPCTAAPEERGTDSRVPARMFQSLRVAVMTADNPDDIPRSPFAARLYDAIRDSVRSSGRLPANPPAASELERAIMELSRGEPPARR